MSLEIEGKLIEKFEEQIISEKFKKREFVLETKEKEFTEQIKFELINDRIDIIDNCNIGDTIKVAFNVRGRKWQDKYFVNLNAWKVESVVSKQQNTPPNAPPIAPPPTEDDSLPF